MLETAESVFLRSHPTPVHPPLIKTDIKDVEWIAKPLHHGLLKGNFSPPQAQRDVRELTRLRSTVVDDRSGTVNRLQMILEQANLKLASVVRDVMGTSARAMLEAIVAGQVDPKVLAGLAQGRFTREDQPFGASPARAGM